VTPQKLVIDHLTSPEPAAVTMRWEPPRRLEIIWRGGTNLFCHRTRLGV